MTFLSKIFFIALFLFSSLSFSEIGNRVGLFIASVDPITEAHIDVIKAGIAQLHLNKIIVMVNSGSDKDYSASVDERIKLVHLALNSLNRQDIHFEVISEPVEGKRNFAIRVAHEQGQGILYQIAGQDVQAKATELYGDVSEVKSYILPRINPGQTAADAELLKGFHLLSPSRVTSISSTEVKQRLESGDSVAEMIDPAVLNEIVRARLYFPLSDQAAQLKGIFLKKKMKLLCQAIQKSVRWKNMSLPDLSQQQNFNVLGGVSTKNSTTFNRIQSTSASDELLVRIILKKSTFASKLEQAEFKEWAFHQFKNKSNLKLNTEFEKQLSHSEAKTWIIPIEKDTTLPSLLEQMKKHESDPSIHSDVLLITDSQAPNDLVQKIKNRLSEQFNIQLEKVNSENYILIADTFLRRHQSRPLFTLSQIYKPIRFSNEVVKCENFFKQTGSGL